MMVLNQTRLSEDIISKITRQLKEKVLGHTNKNLTHIEIQVHSDQNR